MGLNKEISLSISCGCEWCYWGQWGQTKKQTGPHISGTETKHVLKSVAPSTTNETKNCKTLSRAYVLVIFRQIWLNSILPWSKLISSCSIACPLRGLHIFKSGHHIDIAINNHTRNMPKFLIHHNVSRYLIETMFSWYYHNKCNDLSISILMGNKILSGFLYFYII